MYGTPLSLLQLPTSALPEVTQKMSQPGITRARFAQDGKSLDHLKTIVAEVDFQQAAETDVEVGYVCKKCQMVYPSEVLCLNHQRSSCFANKPAGDVKATLKLTQVQFECKACRERFVTIMDFKFHCDMDRHVKRIQKLSHAGAAAVQSHNDVASLHPSLLQPTVPSSTPTMPTLTAASPHPVTTAPAMLSGLPSSTASGPPHLTPAILTPPPSLPVASTAPLASSLPLPTPIQSSQIPASDGSQSGLPPDVTPAAAAALLFAGVQQDFRGDMASSVRMNKGLDGASSDEPLVLDVPTTNHSPSASKVGMCNSGELTVSPELTRL